MNTHKVEPEPQNKKATQTSPGQTEPKAQTSA
ncbi:MAG: hypothetical protein ACI9XZ_002665, partial [Alphaproteobacteria bacterium]